ncbi:Rab3 GTPase-activating protein regulatory subunit N-terminus-domain-containing protein [Pelagophyceae sp. CCMP2097]|nr:Rab3 GTPase-activating protein regulatory subunit N-terminus-domain-containing protein [Pelagophyceae sp. CCMP2097]
MDQWVVTVSTRLEFAWTVEQERGVRVQIESEAVSFGLGEATEIKGPKNSKDPWPALVKALCWVGTHAVACGASDGTVRVLDVRSRSVAFVVRLSRRRGVDEISAVAGASAFWARSGARCLDVVWEEAQLKPSLNVHTLPAMRGNTTNAMAALDESRRTFFAVGKAPTIATLDVAPQEKAGRFSAVRGLASALIGGFFGGGAAAGAQKPSLRASEDDDDDEDIVYDVSEDKAEKVTAMRHAATLFEDGGRTALAVSASPCGAFAAVSDDLGRVLLVDVSANRVVRTWKGVRNAKVAWLSGRGGAAYLAVHAPKRGLLRAFRLAHGGCVLSVQVGPGRAVSLVGIDGRAFLAKRDADGGLDVTEVALDAAAVATEASKRFSDDRNAIHALADCAMAGRNAERAAEIFQQILQDAAVDVAADALDAVARASGDDATVLLRLVRLAKAHAALRAHAERVEKCCAARHVLAGGRDSPSLFDERDSPSLFDEDEDDGGAKDAADVDMGRTDAPCDAFASYFAEARAWLDVSAAVEDDFASVDGASSFEAQPPLFQRAVDALERIGVPAATARELREEAAAPESIAAFHRGLLVLQALCAGPDADEAWVAALRASARAAVVVGGRPPPREALYGAAGSHDDVCKQLCRFAQRFCARLFDPLSRHDVFSLRAVDDALAQLGLAQKPDAADAVELQKAPRYDEGRTQAAKKTKVDSAAAQPAPRCAALLGLAFSAWFSGLEPRRAAELVSRIRAESQKSNALLRWLGGYVAQQTAALAPNAGDGPDFVADVLRPVLDGLCAARLRPAHSLATAALWHDAVRAAAAQAEAKSYGALDAGDERWGSEETVQTLRKLRAVCLLSLGPPRIAGLSVARLESGELRLADIVAPDAACACDGMQKLSAYSDGDGAALARLALARPERGWVDRCFPRLDTAALRCASALDCAAGDDSPRPPRRVSSAQLLAGAGGPGGAFEGRYAGGPRPRAERLAYAANELRAAAATAPPPQHVVVRCCAQALWASTAAPLLLAALRDVADEDVDASLFRPAAAALNDGAARFDDSREASHQLLAQSFAALLHVLDADARHDDDAVRERVMPIIDPHGGDALWPDHSPSQAVVAAWDRHSTARPDAGRLKQLRALSQAIALALQAQLLPLSNVGELFGLHEHPPRDLSLHTPPDDAAAAFADVALSALRQAAASPADAHKFRQAAAKRRVDALRARGHFAAPAM